MTQKSGLIESLNILLVALIIIMMQVFSRIKEGQLKAQAPYLFLKDNDRNRLMTTLVFGFLSQNVAGLIIIPISDFGVCTKVDIPEIYICNFFAKMMLATVHAMIAYPLFALITSPHILFASLLGIFFVIWQLFRTGFYYGYDQIPAIVFLVSILFGFVYRVCYCIRTGLFEIPAKEESVVQTYQINHVCQLIKRRSLMKHKQRLVGRVKGLFKPWYKFPPVIFHSLVIILSSVYVIGTSFFIGFSSANTQKQYINLLVISLVVSILVYLFNILHFLFCVQQDTFSVYIGNHHKLFDKKDKNFNLALYHHIVFPAYLVSAMLIGFILCFAIVGFVIFLVYFMVTLMPAKNVFFLVRLIVSFSGVSLGFKFIQRLIIRYCLTDRDTSKLAINLKHVRMFYVLAFFMFFVNVIKSGMSFLKRLLMTVITLLLFFGRIDRNPLMFFKRMDISATYGSFLRVENAFKNPTMRLFCQILLEPDVSHVLNLKTQDSLRNVWGCVTKSKRGNLMNDSMGGWTAKGLDDYDSRSKDSKINKNRWHLAYTLINNPSLVKQRRLQNYTEENFADDSTFAIG